MKKLAILGSTGSIGTQTLDIVREHPEDFEIVAVSANTNVEKAEQQVREFKCSLAVMADEKAAEELKFRLADKNTRVLSGMEGMLTLACLEEVDILVTAVVGMIGIRPTLAAIQQGKTIALANKETLVTAGHLIMPAARQSGADILPVDSEHSAIFQCLQGEKRENIEALLITASGGPFYGRTKDELSAIEPEDALRHPNWSMGNKITIDSATMVNKGLEVMEARWLFGVDLDQISVVVQPQSIIHSMVQYSDGAVLAQLGLPDMHLPIQYALYYPERKPLPGDRLDFRKLTEIRIGKVDEDTFRGLPLALQAARIGGTMPTVFNAANEAAVALFLHHQCRFLDIYERISSAMNAHRTVENPTLGEILEAEAEARELVYKQSGR